MVRPCLKIVDLGVQKVPVTAAPAVDALLDVAHDEVAALLRFTLPQQREEILPLDVGRVLELVQQEMLVAHAQLLVHEGRVGAADDLAQQGIGFVQAEDVLLRRQRVEFFIKLARQAELEKQLVQQQGGAIGPVGEVEELLDLLRSFGQFGRCGLLDLFARDGFDTQRHRLLAETLHHPAAGRADAAQALLAEGLPAGDAFLLRELAELVVLEQPADLQQAFVHLVAPSLLERVREALADPVEQLAAVLGQRVEDAVHRLGDQRILVQLDLVVGELPDLAGERLQRLLEEAVDGADGEGAVVVKHVREQDLGPGVGLGALRQVAQDPGLHLARGLVGEGHRQDVAVRVRLPAAQQQVDVGVRKRVCLAGTGAGFQDLHRPQMFLKSHHSQVFASAVRVKGTAGSAIRASRPWSRSSIRVTKRPPTATLSTSLTKRREGW